MDVSYQRRMAAEILKCGIHRVWIDPDQLEEVAEAVTRGDVRRLISYRVIQVRQKMGVSRGRTRSALSQKAKGRRAGPGSRKGRKYARNPRKRAWIRTIRPLRDELKRLRDEGKLDPTTYRIYYRKARGNLFRSRADLLMRLEGAGVLSEEEVKQRETARERAQREREERRRKAAAARERVRKKAAEARAAREAAEAEARAAQEATEGEMAEEVPPKEEAAEEASEEGTEEASEEGTEEAAEEASEEEAEEAAQEVPKEGDDTGPTREASEEAIDEGEEVD